MTFGERLQELRKEKSISQEQFAEIMNVSRQAVSKWELNQSYPEMDKLIEISDYFDVSLDYLVKNQIYEEKTDEGKSNQRDLIDNNKVNTFDIDKMIIITAIVLALTAIRFLTMGDFKSGCVLIAVSIIFVVVSNFRKNRKTMH